MHNGMCFNNECSVCGKYFPPKIEYDNQFKVTSVTNKHKECAEVTSRITIIKEQIKKLKSHLLDEEFTLFCIKMSKHNIDE